MSLVDSLGQRLGERFDAVNHHLLAIQRSICNRHLAQGLPSLVPLPRQPRDDANSRVVLVQRRRQLLPRARKLLFQVVCFQGQRVPLVLERSQERGDRRQGRRTGAHDGGGLDRQQVLGDEGLACAGFRAMLVDVLLDQTLLVNDPFARVSMVVVPKLERSPTRLL